MADDSLKPPLTRRIPGAARSGPRSMTRPVLPDALLRRMQAAVDAARAGRDREQPGWAVRGPAPVTRAAISAFGEISRPAPIAALETASPDTASLETASLETAAPQTASPETAAPQTAVPETAAPHTAAPQTAAPQAAAPEIAAPEIATSLPVTSYAVTGPPAIGRALPVQAPFRPAQRRRRRRGPRVAGAAALAVILFSAGAVAATLWAHASGAAPHGTRPHGTPRHSTPPSTPPPSSPPPSSPSPNPATVAANIAASWVATQVSHNDFVACDKAMCDALTAHGFPGGKLQLIRPKSGYPLHAQVAVVTPVVARQFGSTFATKWAPAVLTRVGSGAPAIFIRIVSSKGAAAYNSALSKDVQQRKASAQHLLSNAHVKATAAARNDLAQGRVDARLIVVLTALASVHPIEIQGFGTVFAGASPGIPLRVANLAPYDAASRMKWPDYFRFLHKELAAQPTPFRPQSARLIHYSASTSVFQIEFSAPSPLGIVGP